MSRWLARSRSIQRSVCLFAIFNLFRPDGGTYRFDDRSASWIDQTYMLGPRQVHSLESSVEKKGALRPSFQMTRVQTTRITNDLHEQRCAGSSSAIDLSRLSPKCYMYLKIQAHLSDPS
jgi:hypothetical protein